MSVRNKENNSIRQSRPQTHFYFLYWKTKSNYENAHEKIYKLTNAFSKKIENHCHAIALHFVYYNFVKIHKTLRVPSAMEVGLIKRLMSMEDIVRLTEK